MHIKKIVCFIILKLFISNIFALSNHYEKDIILQKPWTTFQNFMPTGAIYGEIVNNSQDDIKLLKITSPQFADVQFHQTSLHNGVYRMHHLDDVIIKSQSKMILKPKDFHIMLMDKQELAINKIDIVIVWQTADRTFSDKYSIAVK